jgi:hypothetical protein
MASQRVALCCEVDARNILKQKFFAEGAGTEASASFKPFRLGKMGLI